MAKRKTGKEDEKKREQEAVARAKANDEPERKVGFVEKGGSQFVVPQKQLAETTKGKISTKIPGSPTRITGSERGLSGGTPETQEIARQIEDLRVTAASREVAAGSVSDPIIEGLKEDILTPPTVEPETGIVEGAVEGIAETVLTPGAVVGDKILDVVEGATGKKFNRITAEDMANTNFGKLLGLVGGGALAVGTGLAGAAAIPTVLKAGSAIGIKAAVAKPLLGLATAGASIVVGGAALDLNGGAIQSLRGEIAKMPGLSSTTKSSFDAGGLSFEEATAALEAMAQGIDDAESDIQQLAILNLKFKFDKKHRQIQAEIQDARTNVLERLAAIRLSAETGRPTLDPTAAMLSLNEIAELEGALDE